MAIARTRTVTLTGLNGHVVTVEAQCTSGLPTFTLVGLVDATLRESRDRVRAALSSCGIAWGEFRTTVSLTPADIPKNGSGADLALAIAILSARGLIPSEVIGHAVHLGEVGLDGTIHPIRGILPAVACAAEHGISKVFVPEVNRAEASLIPGITIISASHIAQVARYWGGQVPHMAAVHLDNSPALLQPRIVDQVPQSLPDMRDVIGHDEAKFALEVAAAGGHHVLMVGAPGSGKTMLAQRLPGILPPLDDAAAVDVTSIHSIAGMFQPEKGLIRQPPFRSPHHSVTKAALIGGGSATPRPGDISLAHRGVLFLDEAPEFSPAVLDCLRQPLEEGTVTIDRIRGRATFPAQFQLVMAANPCPCGYLGDRTRRCTCTSLAQRRYFARLSGPLLDRIDIHISVKASAGRVLAAHGRSDSSQDIAARVKQAQQRSRYRLRHTPWTKNCQVPGSWLRKSDNSLESTVMKRLSQAMDQGLLTLRGVDKVLRVAWTLADLEERDTPSTSNLAMALAMRIQGPNDDHHLAY
ncbi:YifB family Mg chelatase-like AAA ATPase [Actinomyces vulturis]|uniref:YifB family Mg chelatase-like AAA ATPase n=1 Tax=Actinomyces vulturis TaxID=1857645 RepID=UPI000831EC9D|nr:YifB family Mg chelatase-like AAA ATPase [Actinomyces vulturis]